MTPAQAYRIDSGEDKMRKRDKIATEGDVADTMLVFTNGQVKLSSNAHKDGIDDEQTCVLGRGDSFGEIALVLNESRPATLVAISSPF